MDLVERYVEALEWPSDIQGHLATFANLAAEAEAVIELGTRGGMSTIAWLYGLQGHGHLWSVDIDPAPDLAADHWTFVQGDDCSPEVLNQLPSDVDIVFIDTSHAYEHTLRELALYAPRVKPGGLVLLHDTELEQPENIGPSVPFPVKRAVEKYCDQHGLVWTNETHSWGLGRVEV